MASISVIIPALNEEDSIVNTIEAVRKLGDHQLVEEVEVVVVNDGSTDRTGELASGAGAKVITNIEPSGYGRALKTGIKRASFNTLVITDADGTYPIEDVPVLLEQYERGYPLVVGQRTGAKYRQSMLKYPMRLLLKGLVSFTTGRHVPDPNSGLRVFSKSAITPLLPHLSNTFSFTTTMTMSFIFSHYPVKHVPIKYHARVGDSKVRLFRDTLRTLQYIVQTTMFFNPVKLFLVLSLLSLMMSATIFLFYFFAGGTLVGMLCVMFLFLAFLSFFFGLLGELLRKLLITQN